VTSDSYKIGLIVPSSNTVMEPDFHRQLGAGCRVSTARIFLEQVTRQDEIRMVDQELPQAARRIKTGGPDLIVFGCTSAGSLGGLRHDAEIARGLEAQTGVPALTVMAGVLRALASLAPRRIGVFTPYVEDLTRSVVECVVEAGHEVAHAVGMGLVSNRDIGGVSPVEIAEFVLASAQGKDLDCLFLSCTNWQAIDALPLLKERLRITAISSNQCAIDAVRAHRDRI